MPNNIPSNRTITDSCDFRSDDLAKLMLENLIGEKNFDIDDIEWDDSKITVPDDLMASWKTDVDPVTIEELTSRQAFGSGVFDAIMEAVHNHLKIEYDKNRITGAEYATTYTKLTEAAMANAVQFCLQKNQAYFQGILAQAQAITAGINAQIAALTAKVQLAKTKAEALGVAAQYALTAMKLSTEDAQHALTCKQQVVADAQILQTEAQTTLIEAQTVTQGEQAALVHQQGIAAKYQADMINPNLEIQDSEGNPINRDADGDPINVDYRNKKLQMEDQKAQTAIRELQLQANQPETPIKRNELGEPILVDGQPVKIEHGNIDFLIKEKQLEETEERANLYETQAEAYEHKWQLDVGKLFADQYTAMKSVDEGLALPKAFSGASINEVLQTLKTSTDLGMDTTHISEYNITNTTKNSQGQDVTTVIATYSASTEPPYPTEDDNEHNIKAATAEEAYIKYGVLTGTSNTNNKEETDTTTTNG